MSVLKKESIMCVLWEAVENPHAMMFAPVDSRMRRQKNI
jgi:hypothetical protein